MLLSSKILCAAVPACHVERKSIPPTQCEKKEECFSVWQFVETLSGKTRICYLINSGKKNTF